MACATLGAAHQRPPAGHPPPAGAHVRSTAPVILALTEDGTISNASTGLDFPNADASGAFRLSRTYDFDENDPAQAAIYKELTDRLAGRGITGVSPCGAKLRP